MMRKIELMELLKDAESEEDMMHLGLPLQIIQNVQSFIDNGMLPIGHTSIHILH